MMPTSRYRALALLFMVMCLSGAYAGEQLRVFTKESYQGILESQQSQAFLLVLWSLDCPPCIDELKLLGEFHSKYPELKMVFVSTDSLMQQQEIYKLLQESGLQNTEQWVFSSDAVSALRYAIDSSWYGELPRSYFYLPGHERQSVSGRLSAGQLRNWRLVIAGGRK